MEKNIIINKDTIDDINESVLVKKQLEILSENLPNGYKIEHYEFDDADGGNATSIKSNSGNISYFYFDIDEFSLKVVLDYINHILYNKNEYGKTYIKEIRKFLHGAKKSLGEYEKKYDYLINADDLGLI